jgi:hypothetical protein
MLESHGPSSTLKPACHLNVIYLLRRYRRHQPFCKNEKPRASRTSSPEAPKGSRRKLGRVAEPPMIYAGKEVHNPIPVSGLGRGVALPALNALVKSNDGRRL